MADPGSQRGDEETLKLVGFRIEDWRFAVRLAQVQTAIMPCTITRVFHVPEHIRGIVSLRGTIVGVLDLGRLLGLSRLTGGYTRLLVVAGGNVQAAIPVHDVFRIPDIPVEKVEPLPTNLQPSQKQYLEGVINISDLPGRTGRQGEDTITLIDVDMVFESPIMRELRGGRRS